MSFDQFMAEQIAAIEAAMVADPDMTPDTWIELHAEEFRASHEVTE